MSTFAPWSVQMQIPECTCCFVLKIKSWRPEFNKLYAYIKSELDNKSWDNSRKFLTEKIKRLDETYVKPTRTALFSVDTILNEAFFLEKTEDVLRRLIATALVDLPLRAPKESKYRTVTDTGDEVVVNLSKEATKVMRAMLMDHGKSENSICIHHAFLCTDNDDNRMFESDYKAHLTGTELVASCPECSGGVLLGGLTQTINRSIVHSFYNPGTVIVRAWDCDNPLGKGQAPIEDGQLSLNGTDYLQATIEVGGTTYTVERSIADHPDAQYRDSEAVEDLHALLAPVHPRLRHTFEREIRRHAATAASDSQASSAAPASKLSDLSRKLGRFKKTISDSDAYSAQE